MEKKWIDALGRMTYGIYVLTSAHEDNMNGMIASWVSQISYTPPLIMVAVHPNRYTHDLIKKSGSFALHIIDVHQKDFLSRFKGPDPKSKFEGVDWDIGKSGSPVLKDCIACIECEVTESIMPGNHTLFIGKIVSAELIKDINPLCTLDYEGVYLGRS